MGEDAVPIEEDEGPSTVRNRANERKKNPEPLSDMELAAQALNRLTNPSAEATPIKRRGRPKGGNSTSTQSFPPSNTIKTPRRSAWLARKEAADSDVEIPFELPPRTRRSRSSLQNVGTTIDISSAFEDSGDGGVLVDDEETDSLFGEPIERDQSDYSGANLRASTEEPSVDLEASDEESSLHTEISDEESSIQTADPRPFISSIEIQALGKAGTVVVVNDGEQVEKPMPKRRGRPPKNPRPAEIDSASPVPQDGPAPVTKLLSLKEKLALKGKSFRIVAKSQAPAAPSSGPSSASHTPSIPLKSILKTTTASPAWNKFDDEEEDEDDMAHVTPFASFNRASKPKPAMSTPAPVVKSGPTVVRLLSPSTEPEGESSQSRSVSPSVTPSDSDSGSDTSIPAVRVSPNQARRGRGGTAMRGRTAVRGRGRPRGRPSLGRVV